MFHVAQNVVINWTQVLDRLEKAGLPFARVSVIEWLKRVEATSDDLTDNPSKKMLFLWQRTVRFCLNSGGMLTNQFVSVWHRSTPKIPQG